MRGRRGLRGVLALALGCFAFAVIAGCGGGADLGSPVEPGLVGSGGAVSSDEVAPGVSAGAAVSGAGDDIDVGGGWSICVLDPAGDLLLCFTEAELGGLVSGQNGLSAFVYSTINNWPNERYYVAEGYGVDEILRAAGVFDTAMTVTFRADDGYEVTLTREQLFCEQYYFPRVGEDGGGAETVVPMIAYRWREGTDDLGEVRDDKPIFIFGQRDPFEHTNPAFVVGVTEIVVGSAPPGAWQEAGTFPPPGAVEPGGSVKLEHPSLGLVKLFYTLDGSDPTRLSALYNPSTYRPELNLPIIITGPVTIKVLVVGYGKADSGIAAFEFTVG